MTTRQEVESRIAAFAAAQIPPLAVSYENVSFTRPTNAPWLECFMMAGPTITVTVDATRNRDRGSVAINVYIPSGKGAGQAEAIVAQLSATFTVIPKVGTVSVESPLNVSKGALTNDGWYCIPTNFPYRVESSV